MSNVIKLKRGSGSDPSASDLVVGELAIRTDTGKIFLKKDNGNVAEVSGGGGVADGDKGDITVSNSGDTFTIDNNAITTNKIANNAVSSSKLAQLSQNRILGRVDAGTGDVQFLTRSEAQTVLNVEDGATADQTASEILSLLSNQNIITSGSGTFNNGLTIKDASGSDPTISLHHSAIDVLGEYLRIGRTDNNIRYHSIKAQSSQTVANNLISFHLHSGGNTSPYTNQDEVLKLQGNKQVTIAGNLDVGAGIDVTGDITITGGQPALSFIDDGQNPDYKLYNNNGVLRLYDITNTTDRLVVNSDGHVDVTGNLDVGAGLDVTGNLVVNNFVRSTNGYGVGSTTVISQARELQNVTLNSSSVTATTQAAGNNTTRIATTAFVSTAIANLIDSSPSTLNTLNELASALGDDPNFATTVTNSIATKLPLAGGTLTGTLTISNAAPNLLFTDSDHNPDFGILASGGQFRIQDTTNTANLMTLDSSKIQAVVNLDALAGLDVTGDITCTSDLILDSTNTDYPRITLHSNATGIRKYAIINGQGWNQDALLIYDVDGDNTRLTIEPNGLGINRGANSISHGLDVGGTAMIRGNTEIRGNISLSGDATTTNQNRTISFTGFDKESTSDTSDNAYIRHTVNTGGLSGSVLEIGSVNDSNDGIAFNTNNHNNNLRLNSNIIWNAGNDGSGTGLDADRVDGLEASSFLRSDANDDATGNFNFSDSGGSDDPVIHVKHTGSANGNYGGALLCENQYGNHSYGMVAEFRVGASGQDRPAISFSSGNSNTHIWGIGFVDNSTDHFRIRHGYGFRAGGWGTTRFSIHTDGTLYAGELTNKIWHQGNDGSGSGLDADTVDGIQGASFVRSDANDSLSGVYTFTNSHASEPRLHFNGISGAGGYVLLFRGSNDGGSRAIHFVNGTTRSADGGANTYTIRNDGGSLRLGKSNYSTLIEGSGDLTYNGNEVWHAANDGSGSGLDADKLDGVEGSNYLRSDTSDDFNGTLTIHSSGTNNYGRIRGYNNDNHFIVIRGQVTTGQSSLSITGGHRTTFVEHAENNDTTGWYFVSRQTGNYNEIARITRTGGIHLQGQKVFHAGNDGSGSGLDADLWDGNQFSSYLNQALLTSSTVSFDRLDISGNHGIDNNGWYRNDASGEGLYNTATGQHFYSDNDDYWNIAGGTGANGLRFRDENGGTVRGYVYANNSNHVGFLNQNAAWTLRTQTNGITKLGSNGYQLVDGNVAQNLKYISGNNSSDVGISGFNSGGTWKFQLYGATNYYGFLTANWGSWDIRKNIDGQLNLRVSGTLYTAWHNGNDGSGSGLDADTLDGINSGSFLRSDANDTYTGTLTLSSATLGASQSIFLNGATNFDNLKNSGFYSLYNVDASGHTNAPFKYGAMISAGNTAQSGGMAMQIAHERTGAGTYIRGMNDTNDTWYAWREIWTSGTDGSGSGLDADTLDGMQPSASASNNTIVQRNGNGYVFANYFNTTANDTGGAGDVNRFYCSEDNYIRYIDKPSMRSVMNVSGRSSAFGGRETVTSDQNYWIGSCGWGSNNFDTTVWDYGSCFFDVWSNPSGQPSGTSHWQGIQSMHYTNGSARYGFRIACGAGNTSLAYIQGRWNTTTYGWHKLWNEANDGSGSGLDSDTVDGKHANVFISSGAQSSVSGNWHVSGYRNGVSGSPQLYFSHSGGYGQHINTYNQSGSVYALQLHNSSKEIFAVYNDGTAYHRGHVLPGDNNTYNLGGTNNRWNNIYVNDMHFSNEGKTNDVDGTWGDWTLQEGESDIFMINNRSGKKFKIAMIPV